MPSTVFDSELYSTLFAHPAMHDIWSEYAMIEAWLAFERSLAQAEAALNIIPQEAAEKICQYAVMENIQIQAMQQDVQKTGMAIKPLLNQIIAASNDDLVKQYLHWGSTTQDVLDTATAMRIKQSLEFIKQQLMELIAICATMAERHQDTVMVARTNAQDALPSTWGLQVSSYLMEFMRNLQRLEEATPRATTGMVGGAVGNLSSLGEDGMALRNKLLDMLNLSRPVGFWNGSQDNIVEVLQLSAIIHGSLQRMANDIELMGRAPIAELQEGDGKNSSSTMPHKNNPRASNMIQTLARLGFMYATAAPNLMDQTDIRSASMRMLNWSILPEALLCLSASLDRAKHLMTNLKVNEKRMRENFSASKNFVMSEAVMMKLAEKIGRKQAYDHMSAITKQGSEAQNLEDLLYHSVVSNYLSKAEILAACDPKNYLGCNKALIEEALQYTKTFIKNNS